VRSRTWLFGVAALVSGACGGGGAKTAHDAATMAVDSQGEIAPKDAPGEMPPTSDTATHVPDSALEAAPDKPVGNFIAIVPCPEPSVYIAATQVITTADNRYSPECVRIAAGGALTIEASAAHPLEPRLGGSPDNPIPSQIGTTTVPFPTPGFYPFLCPEHIDQGMRGVVWVTGS
jgi:plastocyanin